MSDQFKGLDKGSEPARSVRVAARPVQASASASASAWSYFLPLALAVYLGITAAGLTIAAGVRLYLHWSVSEWKKDTAEESKRYQAELARELEKQKAAMDADRQRWKKAEEDMDKVRKRIGQ